MRTVGESDSVWIVRPHSLGCYAPDSISQFPSDLQADAGLPAALVSLPPLYHLIPQEIRSMATRSHLHLIRRSRTVANAAGYSSASMNRCVLKVGVYPHCWPQDQSLVFVVYRNAVSGYLCDLRVLASPQFWSGYQYFTNLFIQRLASCPYVRIYH